MKGLEMLLKSFGISPDVLKQQVEGVLQGIEKMLAELNARLKRIENHLGIKSDGDSIDGK